MEKEKVIEIFKEVFKNSMILPSKACLSDDIYYKCVLANSKEELANGILQNDPLSYMFNIENNTYIENHLHIHIKPDNKYMCYSSVSIRKKTIKNINEKKLKNRFLQVKQLIIDNKDNFINLNFDINEKI